MVAVLVAPAGTARARRGCPGDAVAAKEVEVVSVVMEVGNLPVVLPDRTSRSHPSTGKDEGLRGYYGSNADTWRAWKSRSTSFAPYLHPGATR